MYPPHRNWLRVLCVLAVGLATLVPAIASAPLSAAVSGDPSRFMSVGYQRLFATGTQAQPAMTAGETRSVRIAGTLGIPSNVEAVVVDVTATSATSASFVQLWEAGTPRPGNQILRTTPGTAPQTNTAIIKPDSNGLASLYNSAGTTNLNIDVQGYFTAGSGGAFTAKRYEAVNTATGLGAPSSVANGTTISTQVTGADVPAEATAVFANISVVYPGADGSLKFSGRTTAAPSATAFNFSSGATDTTGMVINLDQDGGFKTHVATT